jgi:hypothetical protein
MDAYSVRFGQQVVIRRVLGDDTERDSIRPFSQGDFDLDPQNHVVRILEMLELPNHPPPSGLLVTPLLRDFDTVGEFLDFAEQLLEVGFNDFPTGGSSTKLLFI